MTALLQICAYGCLALLVLVYAGYPLVLWLLGSLLRHDRVRRAEIAPAVSLLVSCHNEERVIRAKLENALALDYPPGLLEIVVVSDASTDRTDEIAAEYADRGVRLIRQERRLGKTSALNLAVPRASGEIVVFSDANAFYRPDAIRKLVRNFADPRVGYAVGEARYAVRAADASGQSENVYWRWEGWIKTMETRLHSVVGGDGAIYAIRRELYQPLRPEDINDFVNPLQIVAAGYRGVYDPAAVCEEETAGTFAREFRRKVRIVNRSFSGLLRVPRTLNPLRVGLFAFEVAMHKLLRWLAPFFGGIFVLCALLLALRGSRLFAAVSVLIVLFYWLFYVGYLLGGRLERLPALALPYYFVLVNTASLLGVLRSLRGRVQATWEPPRSRRDGGSGPGRALTGLLVHAILVGLTAHLVFVLRSFPW